MTKEKWLVAEKNLTRELKTSFLKNIERNELKFLEGRNDGIVALDKNKNTIIKIKERRNDDKS